MNVRLKEFLIKDFEKMPPGPKLKFLRMLKHNPQAVTEIIRNNIIGWGTVATFEIGENLEIYDVDSDSAELTKCLQEHFEKDLQTVLD